MAVTRFQAEILQRIARLRIDHGETYIAGGLALNHQLRRPRVSSDIDVFNSTYEALEYAADRDCKLLEEAGYQVTVTRKRDYIVEVRVSNGSESTEIQWVQDSAYRFFPLVIDELLGLTLHPFDLATNKLLALANRRVPRDWVDTITSSECVQPLGYLAWAGTGKDPGLTPNYILEMAVRTRYSQLEFDMAIANHADYDVAELSRKWHQMIDEAREIVSILPVEAVGKVVMTRDGELFRGNRDELAAAVREDRLEYHEGTIGGAWPMAVER